MKILFLNSEYNGVAYWRMFEPARWLNMSYKDFSVTYFPHDHGLIMQKPTSEWEKLALSHDLIICARISTVESLQTMLVMRELSQKPIIVEMDDDWACVDEQNVAYRDWHPESDYYRCAEAQMGFADMFQLSTLPLKRSYADKLNKPGWISPNLIDIKRMDRLRDDAKKKRFKSLEIRIGWAGGANHYGDLLDVLPVIKEIADKYQNVKFIFCGMNADFFNYQEGHFEINSKGQTKVVRGCPVTLDRVENHEGCIFWKWPEKVADLNFDIVMVPLVDNKFNRAKSNCRYLEMSSLKIPGVYADVYPYANTISDGVDGFLVGTKEQWINRLSELIEREDLRRDISENAYTKVLEKYSFQNNIGIWRKNYEEMFDWTSKRTFKSYFKDESCQIQSVA